MELDFRKLYTPNLFDFSKEQEKLIFEVYDRLFQTYSISVAEIEKSPYSKIKAENENQLLTPKICYYITHKDKTNSFYLYITNKIWVTARGDVSSNKYDTLQIWGIKELHENLEYISIKRKKTMDCIAGIFNKFSIDFTEDKDFNKNFYVLGTDENKTRGFLTSHRRQAIQSFPDENFQFEIKNEILIFGIAKELSVNSALAVTDFLEKI
ncbi:hypothetical protein [Chryseobacterium sp. SIMBA_029]|uniref:hypothetical protein n=1 Tax=Chryseobacterium sp. SIMBA_029 TaxID=3085772 RepID=UPI00397AC262